MAANNTPALDSIVVPQLPDAHTGLVAGTGVVVDAFVGEGEEDFWLGERVRVVGSSRGERIEVKWYVQEGGDYMLEDCEADFMSPDKVLLRGVELPPSADGRFLLSAANEAAIRAALADAGPFDQAEDGC